MLALAAGIALVATPSTARAEAASACPACQSLKSYDKDGLSFRDVEAEVEGNQIFITAEVAVAGTAGKPRTGTITFSAFMDYSDDASFMDYTDDACMASSVSKQAGAQACEAILRALRDAPTTVPVGSTAVPAEGIIMRDGGICDPIRHMGC
jgi:hypothetical protein